MEVDNQVIKSFVMETESNPKKVTFLKEELEIEKMKSEKYKKMYDDLHIEYEKLKKQFNLEKANISPREKNTLLRIICVMAIAGYSYIPWKNRNKTATEISADADELGLILDDGTVNEWIRTAMDSTNPCFTKYVDKYPEIKNSNNTAIWWSDIKSSKNSILTAKAPH